MHLVVKQKFEKKIALQLQTRGQIVSVLLLFVCICVLSKCAYLSIIVLIIPGMISSVSSVSQMTGAVQCVNIRVPASVLRATHSLQ